MAHPAGVPTYERLMFPLLLAAADGEPHRVRDVAERAADHFSLPEDLRREILPDGRNKLIHRMEWARTYLKKAGLLEYPSRGFFRITERGLAALKEKPDGIDNKYLKKFPEFLDFKSARPEGPGVPTSVETHELDPEEAMQDSYQVVRGQREEELLEKVKTCSPPFFEKLVIELLAKMGYGSFRKDAGRVTGKVGDAGIDGIINEDKLGLEVIHVQAKRWEGNVGRPDLQLFVGALQGQQAARKGVFITTSSFNENAKEYAKHLPVKVRLIDGQELAKLMFEYDIGVTEVATYKLKRVDSDYFEE
jgi:restriction system protein